MTVVNPSNGEHTTIIHLDAKSKAHVIQDNSTGMVMDQEDATSMTTQESIVTQDTKQQTSTFIKNYQPSPLISPESEDISAQISNPAYDPNPLSTTNNAPVPPKNHSSTTHSRISQLCATIRKICNILMRLNSFQSVFLMLNFIREAGSRPDLIDKKNIDLAMGVRSLHL